MSEVKQVVSVEALSDLLVCSVCSEGYDTFTRLPKILPCAHSFCLSCLRRGCSDKTYKCPICRAQHTLAAGLSALPSNFVLLQMMEVMHRHAQSQPPSPRLQAPNSPGNKPAQERERCKRHKSEVLSLFCLTCSSSICRECAASNHSEHSHQTLREAFDECKGELATLIQHLRAQTQLIGQTADLLYDDREAFNQRQAGIDRDISAYFQKLHLELKAREAQLRTELRCICDLHTTFLNTKQNEAAMRHASLQSMADELERAVSANHFVRALALSKQIPGQLRLITQRPIIYSRVDYSSFQFNSAASPSEQIRPDGKIISPFTDSRAFIKVVGIEDDEEAARQKNNVEPAVSSTVPVS